MVYIVPSAQELIHLKEYSDGKGVLFFKPDQFVDVVCSCVGMAELEICKESNKLPEREGRNCLELALKSPYVFSPAR